MRTQLLEIVLAMFMHSDVDPNRYSPTDVLCLARAVYHEARGESRVGQRAVAHVVLNRTEDDRFPDSICAVVKQKGQFAPQLRRAPRRLAEPDAFEKATVVALNAMSGASSDPTGGATHFYSGSRKPVWAKEHEAVSEDRRAQIHEKKARMKKIKSAPWVAGLRASLWQDEAAGTFVLSMASHSHEEDVFMEGMNVRVLDEFADPSLAVEMLDLCTKWLGSDELTCAYIQNTEAAIIDSWQDYSLIDWKAEERAEAEELEALPTFGMF